MHTEHSNVRVTSIVNCTHIVMKCYLSVMLTSFCISVHFVTVCLKESNHTAVFWLFIIKKKILTVLCGLM